VAHLMSWPAQCPITLVILISQETISYTETIIIMNTDQSLNLYYINGYNKQRITQLLLEIFSKRRQVLLKKSISL